MRLRTIQNILFVTVAGLSVSMPACVMCVAPGGGESIGFSDSLAFVVLSLAAFILAAISLVFGLIPAPDAVTVAPCSLDCVVDAVGNEAIVNAALPFIKLGGTVGVYGVISQPTLTIQKAKGPYNFNLIVHQWPTRARERAALEPICAWIRAGKLAASEFVTHRFPVADIEKALAAVKAGEALKILMRW